MKSAADPVARLQVVIKNVHIYDDTDWLGDGELTLQANFRSIDDTRRAGYLEESLLQQKFHAGSGANVPLERILPGEGQSLGGDASIEVGLPVYAGQHYQFIADLSDQDVIGGDFLGQLVAPVDEEHGWGIGTFTLRSEHGPGQVGEYDVTYEIRRAPLPDLKINRFEVAGLPGSEQVCGQIYNGGERPSGPYSLVVRTEGKVVEQATLPDLAAGQTVFHCVQRSALPAHRHNAVFSLDETRAIPEMEELNNVDFVMVAASSEGIPDAAPVGPGPAAPSPEPKPSTGDADLTVKAIKLNGSSPDGKDDCQADVTNAVTVVVKNGGTGETGRFTTRLIVDREELDQTVESLRAGEEREVLFERILLKKGEHTFKAVADAEHAVDETREENNERKVSVRCSDGR
jgi:hypothetical protein